MPCQRNLTSRQEQNWQNAILKRLLFAIDLATSQEILVSSTLRDLVIGSGIEFTERGKYDLKGVPGTWNVFAVAA